MHPSDDPDLRKTELRTQIRTRRNALTPEAVRVASVGVAERVSALVRPDAVVAFFAGVRGEIAVGPELLDVGAAAFPRVIGAGEMGFHAVDQSPSALGTYGIPEPVLSDPGVKPEQIDVLLVPGLAFTREGARLGQGGGFYDRFMPKLRSGTPRIGLCHSWQVLDDLPTGPHDVGVTHVVTENDTFVTGSR